MNTPHWAGQPQRLRRARSLGLELDPGGLPPALRESRGAGGRCGAGVSQARGIPAPNRTQGPAPAPSRAACGFSECGQTVPGASPPPLVRQHAVSPRQQTGWPPRRFHWPCRPPPLHRTGDRIHAERRARRPERGARRPLGGPAPPGRLPQLGARSPSVLRAKARPTWLAGSSSSLLAEGPSAFSSLVFFCSAFPAEAVAAGGLPLAGLQPPPCGARAQGGCRSAEGSTTAGRGATAASEQGPLDAHTAAGPLPTGAKAPLGPASKVGAGLLVAKSQDRQEAADLRVYFPTFSTGQLR